MFRVFGAALLLVAGAAQAQPDAPVTDHAGLMAAHTEITAPAAIARDKVTLEEAVRRVRKQYGGRIVSAETQGKGDRRVHVIKVLTDDGRVRTVRISAN